VHAYVVLVVVPLELVVVWAGHARLPTSLACVQLFAFQQLLLSAVLMIELPVLVVLALPQLLPLGVELAA
jgi:hypothetical protein